MILVGDRDFQSTVLEAKGTVLVAYYANWCGPCRMLEPVIIDAVANYGGKVMVIKIDIDESPLTPKTYGVRAVPTMMLFRDGAVVATKIGAIPRESLVEWLNVNA